MNFSGKTGPVSRGHTPCLAECLNRILRNYARLWLVGAAALAFVGCSSLRPIASKPPASVLRIFFWSYFRRDWHRMDFGGLAVVAS